jgi:hypothetical protein
MKDIYQVGDLVHVPQAVRLLNYDDDPSAQLNIPTRVLKTDTPTLGVVTSILDSGYVKIYCEGDSWSVRDENVYKLS